MLEKSDIYIPQTELFRSPRRELHDLTRHRPDPRLATPAAKAAMLRGESMRRALEKHLLIARTALSCVRFHFKDDEDDLLGRRDFVFRVIVFTLKEF